MLDPAAFGTLVIGLNAIRAAEEPRKRELIIEARSIHRRSARRGLAALLRRTADEIEPSIVLGRARS
jgi:hypothetical protein